jgi:hypothetical protein
MGDRGLDSIVQEVVQKFETRAKMGWDKYGHDLDRTDLTLDQWLQHAQEESMDFILYITKIRKILMENGLTNESKTNQTGASQN